MNIDTLVGFLAGYAVAYCIGYMIDTWLEEVDDDK